MSYPLPTETGIEETVRLAEKHDRRIVARNADVRDEGIKQLIDEGGAELGDLDIVVAKAGIVPFAAQAGRRAFADAFDILLTGVYNTVETALPYVLAKGEGGSFLDSPAGRFVTAQSLAVDAGITL